MVYDKRPRRSNQTPQSHEQQNSSSPNIYRDSEPSPIIEQLRQRWIDKRQAREEQSWFDSLPEFDPNRRETSSPHNRDEKPRNQEDPKNRKSLDQTQPVEGQGKEKEPNSEKREKRKRKKEQEKKNKKEKEAKVQGKKRGGWFSLFGAGTRPDKKLKPMTLPQAQGATTIAVPQDRVATTATLYSPPRKIMQGRYGKTTTVAIVRSHERREYPNYPINQYLLPPTSMQ